jgi:hypothetical protein
MVVGQQGVVYEGGTPDNQGTYTLLDGSGNPAGSGQVTYVGKDGNVAWFHPEFGTSPRRMRLSFTAGVIAEYVAIGP